MIEFNGDVIFLDGSGQVRAKNGSLTLRGDDTGAKSIIVGSGSAFRPDRDRFMDNGRPDLRWRVLYTTDMVSPSGSIGNVIISPNVFYASAGDYMFVSGAVLEVDNTSQLITDGLLTVLGTSNFSNRPTYVGGPVSNFAILADLNGLHPVDDRAVSGHITPNTDNKYLIGSPTRRFGAIYAVSGIFNKLSPQTSGTFINIDGSLVPNRTALYSLGTSQNRWGIIYGTSGNISSFVANIVAAADGVFSDTLNVGDGGDAIFEMGSSTMEDNAGDVTWTFNDLTFNGPTIFNVRPKIPTISASGFGLVGENYFEAYGGRALNGSSTANIDILEPDTGGSAIGGDSHFVVNRGVKLANYSVSTQHFNGSPPNPWVLRLRLNDSTTDHASGLFTWSASVLTNNTFRGQWEGDLSVPQGSRCQLIVDNNGAGSGTINVIFAKAWVGFTIEEA